MDLSELFMNDTWCYVLPERNKRHVTGSLGSVTDLCTGAHEALESKGPTHDILERLGMAYMVKGENEAALPFFKSWRMFPFKKTKRMNWSDLMKSGGACSGHRVQNYTIAHAHWRYNFPWRLPPYLSWNCLVRRNPKIKWHSNILIASFLLNGNSNESGNVIRIQEQSFCWNSAPRQEALMMNAVLIQISIGAPLKKLVDPLIYNRFVDYQQIIYKYRTQLPGGEAGT